VIEQLLQLLVRVIDAQLLEGVQLEYLEAGHIQYTNKTGTLSLRPIQRSVDSVHQPTEHPLVAGLRDRFYSKLHLLLCLRLRHKITANLDARLQEGLRHLGNAQTQQMRDFLCHRVVGQRRLIGIPLLTKLHRAKQHHGGNDTENGGKVLVGHAHDVHRLYCGEELGGIVDTWHR